MQRLDRTLTTVENVLAAGSLALAAIIGIVGVISRSVFGYFIFWTEEATIMLVIFSTFLGSVVTLRHNEHVSVDILPTLLRGRARQVIDVLAGAITVFFCAVVGLLAWLLVLDPIARHTVTPALKLPLWVVELSVAVGLTLMLVRAVEMTVRRLRSGPTPGDGPVEEVAV